MAKVWVPPYQKKDGTNVDGHYRDISRSSQASALTYQHRKIKKEFKAFEKASKGMHVLSPEFKALEKTMKPLLKRSRINAAKRSSLSKTTGYWL